MAKVLIVSDEAYNHMHLVQASYQATHIFDCQFNDDGLLKVKCVKNALQPSKQEEATGEGAAFLLGSSLVHAMQVDMLEKRAKT